MRLRRSAMCIRLQMKAIFITATTRIAIYGIDILTMVTSGAIDILTMAASGAIIARMRVGVLFV